MIRDVQFSDETTRPLIADNHRPRQTLQLTHIQNAITIGIDGAADKITHIRHTVAIAILRTKHNGPCIGHAIAIAIGEHAGEDLAAIDDTTGIAIEGGDLLVGHRHRYIGSRTQRRIDLTVGIGYDDDIDRAIEVVRATLDADSRVLSEPAMTVTTGGRVTR